MVKALPQRFNPDLIARDGTRFELVIAQSKMPRLSDLLHSADNDIRASAVFSRRKDHIVVKGILETIYALQCQRCLEPMDVTIAEPYELVFVDSEQSAEALAKELDPVILDDVGQIHVIDLFEDELMLHVPGYPRHVDEAACSAGPTEFGELPADVEEGVPNPFKALKDIQLH